MPAAVVLGNDIHTGQQVHLGQKERLQGLYVIGGTGNGKSTFLLNLIVQDIAQGFGVCVLDPKGTLVDDILGYIPTHRMPHVVYLNPAERDYAFSLNLFECADPDDPEE